MDLRATLDSLRRLIDTREPAEISQAIELALSLDDRALFDAMLDGARWERGTQDYVARIAPGGFFAGHDGAERRSNDRALWQLLLRIPEWHEGARALRESVLGLTLFVDIPDEPAPLDLGVLRGFKNLKDLEIRGVSSVNGISTLRELPHLETLTLQDGDYPEGVGDLSSLTSLRDVKIEGRLRQIGRLGDAPRLLRLQLSHGEALQSLDGLTSLKAIERLTLGNLELIETLEPLRDLTTLRELTLVGTGHPKLTSLRGIENNRELRELALLYFDSVESLDALAGLKALEFVQIYGAPRLTSLAGLAGGARLRRLTINDVPITSLDGLQGSAIESLSLSNCFRLRSLEGLSASSVITYIDWRDLPALASLDGLEAQRDLVSVTITNAPAFASLSALRALDKITSLHLDAPRALASLDGLQNKPALTKIEIFGAVALTDVSALATATSLETLDLYGASSLEDVSALGALPSLKALSLGGTRVKRAALPARLKGIVTFAKDRDLKAIAARGPTERQKPQAPEAITRDTKKSYQRVKKLLLSRDIAEVDQGLELASTLGETAVFDVLLEGVRYDEALRRSPHEGDGTLALGGMFKPNDVFEVPAPGVVSRDRALIGLIARAPDGCATATKLKREVTQLELDGALKHPKLAPVDLAPLPAFKRLRALTVSDALEVQHPEAMGALASLLELAFLSCSPADFSSLRDHPTLRSLYVAQRWDAPQPTTAGLERLPALQRLALHGDRFTSAFTLRDMPRLEDARFFQMDVLEALRVEGCPSLKTLDLTYCGSLRSLDVSGCEALTLLTMRTTVPLQEIHGIRALSQLEELGLVMPARLPFTASDAAGLTALKTLTMWGCPGLTDADALEGLRSLDTLRLRECAELTDVSALKALPRLRSVAFDGCEKLRDVSALDALPALKRLDLTNSGVDPASLSPALRGVLV